MYDREFQKIMPLLIQLCHHRWAIPILAELHHGGGGSKFITLTNRLGVSRSALSNTLTRLDTLGWVVRNPGYGHPLRPEYVLTPAGKRLAPWCARIHGLIRRRKAEDTLLRKWSLPIAFALNHGCARFAELRAALPTITARALTLSLKDLQQAGFATRLVLDDYPPRVEYQLAPRARRLAKDLVALPA